MLNMLAGFPSTRTRSLTQPAGAARRRRFVAVTSSPATVPVERGTSRYSTEIEHYDERQPRHRAAPEDQAALVSIHPSRRQALAAGLFLLYAGTVPKSVASETKSTMDENQQLDKYLNKMMDEIRSQVPQDVRDLDEFMKLPDTEVDSMRLDAIRLKIGFNRTIDGRLFVRNQKNQWFAVKADMYMPGYILLQDSQGLVYYLAPADVRDLQQVDLSDDMVVAMLFSSGEWVQAMRPVELEPEDGKRPPQLKLSEADFRDLLSVLQEPEESEDDDDDTRASKR